MKAGRSPRDSCDKSAATESCDGPTDLDTAADAESTGTDEDTDEDTDENTKDTDPLHSAMSPVDEFLFESSRDS